MDLMDNGDTIISHLRFKTAFVFTKVRADRQVFVIASFFCG
jgi:hypothetical protein